MKSILFLLMLADMAGAQTWDKLVYRYFEEAVFPYSPSSATQAAFHYWEDWLAGRCAVPLPLELPPRRRVQKGVAGVPAPPPQPEFVPFNCRRKRRLGEPWRP